MYGPCTDKTLLISFVFGFLCGIYGVWNTEGGLASMRLIYTSKYLKMRVRKKNRHLEPSMYRIDYAAEA
jgi:hypothetical protein